MFRTFCKNGEKETFKGAFHAAGCALSALMATYNAVAWCYRRERHLAVNAFVYTLATLWETRQTSHHFERLEVACPGDRRLTLVSTTPATTRSTEPATSEAA